MRGNSSCRVVDIGGIVELRCFAISLLVISGQRTFIMYFDIVDQYLSHIIKYIMISTHPYAIFFSFELRKIRLQ